MMDSKICASDTSRSTSLAVCALQKTCLRRTTYAKNAVEQVEKMRASAIKDELTYLGISYADCFEKKELVMRLAMALANKSKSRQNISAKKQPLKPLAQLPITRLRSTLDSPRNYILVPLKINNRGPFNFILDTASTVTLISPSIAKDQLRLIPKPVRQSLALLGGGISNQNSLSVDFEEVKLGEHLLCGISALLMDQKMLQGWDPSVAGLLGLNVLSKFDVEFDFVKDVLVFHSPGAASKGHCDMEGLNKLSTSTIALGLLGVKVALGGAPPEVALLDLGSSLCLANPDIASLAGVSDSVINNKQPTLAGGGLGQLGAMQFASGYIDIRMVVEKGTALVQDFSVTGAQFGIGNLPALRSIGCRILLGVNIFKSTRMIFSQSTESVYMQKPTP